MTNVYDLMKKYVEMMQRGPHVLMIKLDTGIWLGADQNFRPIVHKVDKVQHLVSPLRAILYRTPSGRTSIPTTFQLEKWATYVGNNPSIVELRVDMGLGIEIDDDRGLYPAPIFLTFKQEPGKSKKMCLTIQMPALIDLDGFEFNDGYEYWGENGPLALGERFTISIPIKMAWLKGRILEVASKLMEEATRVSDFCESDSMPSWCDEVLPPVFSELSLRMPAYQNSVKMPTVLIEPVDLEDPNGESLNAICDRLELVCEECCVPFNIRTRFVTLKLEDSENWGVYQTTFRSNPEKGKSPYIASFNGTACFPIHHFKPVLNKPVWVIMTKNGSVWQAVPAELVESNRVIERNGKVISQRIITPYGFPDTIVKVVSELEVLQVDMQQESCLVCETVKAADPDMFNSQMFWQSFFARCFDDLPNLRRVHYQTSAIPA